MIYAMSWLLGAAFSLAPVRGGVACSLSTIQHDACVQSSLLVTMHCQSESQKAIEWLEPNDSRVAWELYRPDGQVERTNLSRYSTSTELVKVDSEHKLDLLFPVTRWFSLKDPGVYRLRFLLKDSVGNVRVETNAAEFKLTPCSDDVLLDACLRFLHGSYKKRFEAIAGFDGAAVVPCMEEALKTQSEDSLSIVDGLARLHTAPAVEVLLRRFEVGDAFERLGIWQALHNMDRSSLESNVLKRVDVVLGQQPVTMKP